MRNVDPLINYDGQVNVTAISDIVTALAQRLTSDFLQNISSV